jgi:hypothetical protein
MVQLSGVPPRKPAAPEAKLSTADWEAAALDALAEHGLAGVAVEALARRLGVTLFLKVPFPRGLLHSSVVAFILVQKFSLGAPHYRLEQHIADQGVDLDRSMMCRYVEEAGNSFGATVMHAMWQDALRNGSVISTDATSASVQPEKGKDGQRQACKEGTFSPQSLTAIMCCLLMPSGTRKSS